MRQTSQSDHLKCAKRNSSVEQRQRRHPHCLPSDLMKSAGTFKKIMAQNLEATTSRREDYNEVHTESC